ILVKGNRILPNNNFEIEAYNQTQTEKIFSDKWTEVEQYKNVEKLYEFQFDWFLKLYGFDSKEDLKNYLSTKKVIIDTGCGLGYKAGWFAELSPQSTVIGIDISDAVDLASKNFSHLSNLYFLKKDIADTGLRSNSIDFVVCDQVIMHTEVPERTFTHLAGLTKKGGEFACYVYSKKALPRELVDDYFRKATHNISNEEMWKFSEQLTELGKRLSELNVSFESPDIPLLGIKGGKYDIQRFIYWNFLKCFWREDWGFELSKSTNYDWYAPSNAKRFSKQEFLQMVSDNNLEVKFFHEEEACYSGRFLKK
ncbi:MAG TPA: class I SAM-dependent methyltransferase, partial [Chitinophagaceae bacterium]|nr:class I SAM-dependent methyltransferase [Chitinophagaceae bacterium]